MRVPSAFSALGFLVIRSFINAVRRRVARLREPRYLVATCVGAAYLYTYLGRALFPRSGGGWTGRPQAWSPELRSLLLLAGCTALAIAASQAWLFFRGRPQL